MEALVNSSSEKDMTNMRAKGLWICGKLFEFPTYPQLLLLLIMLTLLNYKEEDKEKRGHF